MILVFFSLSRALASVDILKIQEDIDSKLSLSSSFSKHDVYGISDVRSFLSSLPAFDTQAVGSPDTFMLTKALAEVTPADSSNCASVVAEYLGSTSYDMCGTTSSSTVAYEAFVSDLSLESHIQSLRLYFLFFSPTPETHTLLEIEFNKIPGTVDWQYLQESPAVGSVGKGLSITAMVLASIWILADLYRVYGWLNDHLHKNKTEGAKLRALGGVTGSKRRLSLWLFANLTAMILIIVACSRILTLGDVDAELEYSDTSASDLFRQLIDLKKSYEGEKSTKILGIFVLYFLLGLLINCLAGHPRVGVLTDTWFSAQDEILHFILSFVLIFCSQAAIANAVFSSQAPVFRSMTSTLNFQFELLWSGQWQDRLSSNQLRSYTLQWFLIFFVLLVQLVLLNFFTAILIESYMAVRHVIASTRYSQSFLSDALDSLIAKIFIKTSRLPRRQDVVSELIKMFATRTVTIDTLSTSDLFDGNASIKNPLFMRFLRFYRKYNFLQPSDSTEGPAEKEAAMWKQLSALLDVVQTNQRKMLDEIASSNENLQLRLAVVEDRLTQILNTASSSASNS